MKFDFPVFTSESPRSDFEMAPDATLISGVTDTEERGQISQDWANELEDRGHAIVRIIEGDDAFGVVGDSVQRVSLYDTDQIAEWIQSFGSPIYLDITAMAHSTWAPIVKASFHKHINLQVVYIEPADYRKSEHSVADNIYDLSETIQGIAPLPGFANLTAGFAEESVFVALAGFEGIRLEHILSGIEIDTARSYPVIGLPGFRPEYPFYALDSNRNFFEIVHMSNNLQFAKANCPFELYYLLEEIRAWTATKRIRIAMVGTKPHALGAILFHLRYPTEVELLYDNPVRKKRRTIGEARLCVYNIADFSRTVQSVVKLTKNRGGPV